MAPLEALGFALAGYGCTTCIGNSGPLDAPIAAAIEANDLVVAAVLSGNRNFEGRIHPLARASYLASPPLVVAFALAGRVDIDLTTEPLGIGSRRRAGLPRRHLAVARRDPPRSSPRRSTRSSSAATYAVVFEGDERWRALPIPRGRPLRLGPGARPTSRSRRSSTGSAPTPAPVADIVGARVLAVPRRLGHDRPHLARPARSRRGRRPASGSQERGVAPLEFNSYGARRGHHEVMMRGTFANIRLRNRLRRAARKGRTRSTCRRATEAFIYDAAMRYQQERHAAPRHRRPRVRLRARPATGRPRAPLLLGVRAVLAESYERIHRSNLVGMGVLPLQFQPGDSAASLGLTGRETFTIEGLAAGLSPRQSVTVVATRTSPPVATAANAASTRSPASTARSTSTYYRQGGILPAVLRRLATES